MATTEFIAAIELSSSKITGIAGKKNSDGSIQVLAYAREEATSCIHKGMIYNIDKATQALTTIIHKLEGQLGNSIAKVYVGIGGQSLRTVKNSISRTLEEEDIISNELIDSICDENRQTPLAEMDILDVAPQEYRVGSTFHVDPVGVSGKNVTGQFLNIVARNTLKKNLELSFEQAKIEIADDLIVAPTTVAQAVLNENEMRSGCALVDLGADTTTILVYKNNILRYLSVIPLGGNNITRDLTSLQIEVEEAEKLKLQYGDALYEEAESEYPATCKTADEREIELTQLNDIIGARTEEILANVWNQLLLSGYERDIYAGVIFTGGGANLKNIETVFQKLSKLEKVKTVKFVHETFYGFSDVLKKDGTCNTLLALLATGKENCCRQIRTTLFEEDEIETVAAKETIEPVAPIQEPVQSPVQEPVKKPEKDNTPQGPTPPKKDKPSFFKKWADKLQGELFNDNSDEIN